MSAPEIQEVISGLSGKPDKLYSEGLHVAGERFVLTKCEDRSLYARKVGYLFHTYLPSSLPVELADVSGNRAEKAL